MLRVDPWAYLFGAVLLLTLPLGWLLAAVTAAAVHEACHLGAAWLVEGKVHGMRIGMGGAAIDADFESTAGELICALAGPLGSLALLTLCHIFPRLALCGACQGIYNLLPVYPLDGGRILRCGMTLLRRNKPP